MLFDLTPKTLSENIFWREDLSTSPVYVAFCATTITAAAIADNQKEEVRADAERIAFNEAIIKKATEFAPMYARITASTIQHVEVHYVSRESFLAYSISNWDTFFAQGKNIIQ